MPEIINIASIRTEETQMRAQMNWLVVNEYGQALKDGAIFPPVVLFHDGTDYWLADGYHRLEAYRSAGETHIPAEIHQGGHRDAILYATGANASHGLRRTREDVQRAIKAILSDTEWHTWSDREIARRVGCTHPTVANVRREMEAARQPKCAGCGKTAIGMYDGVRMCATCGDGYVKAKQEPTGKVYQPESDVPPCPRCGAPALHGYFHGVCGPCHQKLLSEVLALIGEMGITRTPDLKNPGRMFYTFPYETAGFDKTNSLTLLEALEWLKHDAPSLAAFHQQRSTPQPNTTTTAITATHNELQDPLARILYEQYSELYATIDEESWNLLALGYGVRDIPGKDQAITQLMRTALQYPEQAEALLNDMGVAHA